MKIIITFAVLLCHTAQACKITSDNDFGNFNRFNPHLFFDVGFWINQKQLISIVCPVQMLCVQ